MQKKSLVFCYMLRYICRNVIADLLTMSLNNKIIIKNAFEDIRVTNIVEVLRSAWKLTYDEVTMM